MNQQPIIAGFHPDPSICRVGKDYFLVNSSFEYAPGVPIFTSRDLLTWEPVGNVLDRSSQLEVRPGIGGANGGIYAPTLRHHDGRLWMVTTNIHQIGQGHLIVHAENPQGPWSEPVYTQGLIGIDPDLSWDESGTCRITWSDPMKGGISQAQINPLTGEVLSETRTLWRGTGGGHVEGPHLFQHGPWWYLLVAEGGTGHGHMVTIARSPSPEGPFESNPANPILTHRSSGGPVQSTGHADMVELADGSWAIVFLGTRPRGSFPRWHVNGRETFLAGVTWEDGWPVVDEGRFDPPAVDHSFSDDFLASRLNLRWVSPGRDPYSFAQPSADGLLLAAGREPSASEAQALLAVRATDEQWSARIAAQGDVALSVRIDDRHQALVERVDTEVRARIVIGPLDQILARVDCLGLSGASLSVQLEIRSVPTEVPRGAPQGPDKIVLGYVSEDFHELASFDGRYLSTEVAGGFTGRMIGVEALGDPAVITGFTYQA